MHSKNAPRAWLWCLRFGVSLVFGAWCLEFRADAQPTNSIFPIDLPTALQLAGAQNLDVRLVFETKDDFATLGIIKRGKEFLRGCDDTRGRRAGCRVRLGKTVEREASAK